MPHLAMVAGIKIAKDLGVPCISEIRDFWPEVFCMGGKLKEDSIIGRILIKGGIGSIINQMPNFSKRGDYIYH